MFLISYLIKYCPPELESGSGFSGRVGFGFEVDQFKLCAYFFKIQ